MRPVYSTALLWLVTTTAGRLSAQTPAARAEGPPASTYTIFLGGRPVGREEVTVQRAETGWTIASSARLGQPIDVVSHRAEVRYDAQWRPLELVFDAIVSGKPLLLRTRIEGGAASSDVSQNGQTTRVSHPISGDALLLHNYFFGPYAALAARLAGAAPGTELRAYVAPQAEIPIRVAASADEQFQTALRATPARRYRLEMGDASARAPIDATLWADTTGRFLKLSMPGQALEVVRDDLVSPLTRRETFRVPGDEPVLIPAEGFNIGATLTRAPDTRLASTGDPKRPARLPAVVLVPGAGQSDRDEVVGGFPVFGALAGAFSEAGFFVVRYDKRGIGQSGGRTEVATIADYADDVRAIVKYLERRKDVDGKRIAVAGYGEGGWIALVAASRDKRIHALGLIATPGTSGAEFTLEQQRRTLERLSVPPADKQAKIELQQKIQRAVLTGTGWEEIPAKLRRQADTPWFASLLGFDPSAVMPKVRQPVLILHGEADRDIPPHHADRLAQLAAARKKAPPAEVVRFPDVTHVLRDAGDDRTADGGTPTLSPRAASALTAWFAKVLAPAAK